jgi:hypothetical protein
VCAQATLPTRPHAAWSVLHASCSMHQGFAWMACRHAMRRHPSPRPQPPHHAGVMEVNTHGVGSFSRWTSSLYHPMPKPSPFRLPWPRWWGSVGSLSRSRASYDCLMMERSGHSTTSATSVGCPKYASSRHIAANCNLSQHLGHTPDARQGSTGGLLLQRCRNGSCAPLAGLTPGPGVNTVRGSLQERRSA